MRRAFQTLLLMVALVAAGCANSSRSLADDERAQPVLELRYIGVLLRTNYVLYVYEDGRVIFLGEGPVRGVAQREFDRTTVRALVDQVGQRLTSIGSGERVFGGADGSVARLTTANRSVKFSPWDVPLTESVCDASDLVLRTVNAADWTPLKSNHFCECATAQCRAARP